MKSILLLLTLTVVLFSCTRKAGDSCRVNGDCDKDLVCCLSAPDSTQGECTTPESCVNDGGVDDIIDATADGDADAQ
ncbi:hypothetical protein KKF84_10100 [Myxococcota bacterium]|nr:hypothetical protein [Myxococcota bacterium]MBU1535663.1 hypothetical protein [Myxococcota bacterium]